MCARIFAYKFAPLDYHTQFFYEFIFVQIIAIVVDTITATVFTNREKFMKLSEKFMENFFSCLIWAVICVNKGTTLAPKKVI